jgi:hypothetical protein
LLRALFARNAIVHHHNDPLFELGIKDSNLVQASWIVFLGQEHVANGIGKFGSAGKGRDQPTITDGALTQITRLNVAFKELRAFALELLQLLSSHPIRRLLHLLSRLFAFMIAQGLGTIKAIVFVGPTETATDVAPATVDHESLQQDGGTWEGKNVKRAPDQAYSSDNGAAKNVPQGTGSTMIEFVKGRHGCDKMR